MLTFPKYVVHTLKAHGIFRDIRKPSWTSPAPRTRKLKVGAPMSSKGPSTWRPGGLAAPVTHTVHTETPSAWREKLLNG